MLVYINDNLSISAPIKYVSFSPGMFPNHIPNPEDKDAMAAIKKAVLEHGADLGIIFDTDVDRFV